MDQNERKDTDSKPPVTDETPTTGRDATPQGDGDPGDKTPAEQTEDKKEPIEA